MVILLGLPVACLSGLLGFAVSGYVGLIGGFGATMLMIGWGALFAAALSGDKKPSEGMPDDLDQLPMMSSADWRCKP
jgi:hypothetical protein